MVMTVGQAADKIAADVGQPVNPRDISNVIYKRAVRVDLFPVIGGRRLIDPVHLPLLVAALRRAGKLSQGAVV